MKLTKPAARGARHRRGRPDFFILESTPDARSCVREGMCISYQLAVTLTLQLPPHSADVCSQQFEGRKLHLFRVYTFNVLPGAHVTLTQCRSVQSLNGWARQKPRWWWRLVGREEPTQIVAASRGESAIKTHDRSIIFVDLHDASSEYRVSWCQFDAVAFGPSCTSDQRRHYRVRGEARSLTSSLVSSRLQRTV